MDGRFDCEGDEIVHHLFSPAELLMSPEEYAARHAHQWGCFALHLYRFRDSMLGAWVRRIGEIYSDSDELDRCRQRFLTPEEITEVKRQEVEAF